MKQTTREMIAKFSHAFGRPVNSEYQRDISVEDRILLGSLLLEEVVEYCTKGLGLTIVFDSREIEYQTNGAATVARSYRHVLQNFLKVTHSEGDLMNHFEVVDGLADVNVVAHFNAHWHGFNLDEATEVVNDSNMSKLGEDGKPIINECKYDSGHEALAYNPDVALSPTASVCTYKARRQECTDGNHLLDPTKPAGKILKSANFREPDFYRFVFETTNSGV